MATPLQRHAEYKDVQIVSTCQVFEKNQMKYVPGGGERTAFFESDAALLQRPHFVRQSRFSATAPSKVSEVGRLCGVAMSARTKCLQSRLRSVDLVVSGFSCCEP